MLHTKQTIQNHKQSTKKSHSIIPAFTLVELIVVIVILAILATIAFLSFSSYSSSSRDSVRLADINSLNKGVELYNVKSGYYPIPDGTISSGTVNGVDVVYKGIIGDRISKITNINKTPVDPLSTSNYVYGISYDKKYFQVGVALESSSNRSSYIDGIKNNNSNSNLLSFGAKGNEVEEIAYRQAGLSNNNSSLLSNVFNNLVDISTALRSTQYDDMKIPAFAGMTDYLEQTYSASGAGNYFSRIKGNYNGMIKFSSGTTTKLYYIANIPSLLYNNIGNVDLLSSGTYYIVNNNTNLPYQIDSNITQNNKTSDTIIKEVTNKTNATLTGVDITSIVNGTSTIDSIFTTTLQDQFGYTISSITQGIGTTTTATPTLGTWSGNGTIGTPYIYSENGTSLYPLTCNDILISSSPNFNSSNISTSVTYSGNSVTKFNNGYYKLDIDGAGTSFTATGYYCNMSGGGGGWTRIDPFYAKTPAQISCNSFCQNATTQVNSYTVRTHDIGDARQNGGYAWDYINIPHTQYTTILVPGDITGGSIGNLNSVVSSDGQIPGCTTRCWRARYGGPVGDYDYQLFVK